MEVAAKEDPWGTVFQAKGTANTEALRWGGMLEVQ